VKTGVAVCRAVPAFPRQEPFTGNTGTTKNIVRFFGVPLSKTWNKEMIKTFQRFLIYRPSFTKCTCLWYAGSCVVAYVRRMLRPWWKSISCVGFQSYLSNANNRVSDSTTFVKPQPLWTLLGLLIARASRRRRVSVKAEVCLWAFWFANGNAHPSKRGMRTNGGKVTRKVGKHFENICMLSFVFITLNLQSDTKQGWWTCLLSRAP